MEAIEKLMDEFGWDAVRDCLLENLSDKTQGNHWYSVAAVFWGAALDKRPMPIDRVIASLYFRLDLDTCSDEERNLAWSITSELKGIDYLSEYDPMKDPNVLAELNSLQNSA